MASKIIQDKYWQNWNNIIREAQKIKQENLKLNYPRLLIRVAKERGSIVSNKNREIEIS